MGGLAMRLGFILCLFYSGLFFIISLMLLGCGEAPIAESCSVREITEGAEITCHDGTSTVVSNGKEGSQGSSCVVVQVSAGLSAPNGGALINCGLSSVLILNGEPGPQGEPGPVSPYQLSEIIDPCGDSPGIYDEVILRTQSGRLLASFSDNANGTNTRLSELTMGSYVTTDGSNCYFNVNQQGDITW